MIELSVDPDELESVAGDIRTSVTNIGTSLDTLAADLLALSTRWTGAASDAFQAAHRSWNGDMSLLAQRLTAIAKLLDQASAAYVTTETAVVERCSS